jgi:hypothetical protein
MIAITSFMDAPFGRWVLTVSQSADTDSNAVPNSRDIVQRYDFLNLSAGAQARSGTLQPALRHVIAVILSKNCAIDDCLSIHAL